MKTIDVTDWESYSEDEVVKKSTAKPAEPTAKASKPLAKNQKSIANFFNRS